MKNTIYYQAFAWIFLAIIFSMSNSCSEDIVPDDDPVENDSIPLVFVSGTEGYACYRTPAIVMTKKGTSLAFCGGRVNDCQDEGDIDTWVYLDSRVLGQSKRTRYTARIDTGSLYTFYPSINSMIQKEMADALNEIPLRFSVVLPGEIVYHNGDRKIGNEIVWEIPMGEAKELVVESDMEMAGFYEQSSQTNSDVTQTNQNFLKWLIPGGIFLLSTLIFVIKSKNSINEN